MAKATWRRITEAVSQLVNMTSPGALQLTTENFFSQPERSRPSHRTLIENKAAGRGTGHTKR